MSVADDVTAALRALDFPAEWEITARVNPRAKNLSLKVDEHVHVTVSVPEGMPVDRAVYLVRTKRMWMYRQARLLTPYIPCHPVKELVNSAGFRLFGQPVRLHLVDEGPPYQCDYSTRTSGWTRGFSQWVQLRRDHADTAATLIEWIAGEGRDFLARDIPRAPANWCRRMRVDMPTFQVSAAPSCHPSKWVVYRKRTNTMVVNWALFQLDYSEVEYAIGRQLAAIGASTATAARRRIPTYFYDHADRHERLRKEGAHAWLGDIRTTNPGGIPCP